MEKNRVLTQSIEHSPILFDAPGTKAFVSEHANIFCDGYCTNMTNKGDWSSCRDSWGNVHLRPFSSQPDSNWSCKVVNTVHHVVYLSTIYAVATSCYTDWWNGLQNLPNDCLQWCNASLVFYHYVTMSFNTNYEWCQNNMSAFKYMD